jgi:hypothetical protein
MSQDERGSHILGGGEAPEPEEVTYILVGGPKHGHTVTIPAGTLQWTDLATAQTYRHEWFLFADPHPLLGYPVAAWKRAALVHEGLPQPQRVMALANHLFGVWVKEAGDQVPVQATAAPNQPPPNGRAPQ